MKTLNLKNIAALALAATVWMGLPTRAHAVDTPLNFGDARDLGTVLFGIPSGDADRTNYVNFLITMTPGTTATAEGQTFNRSLSVVGAPYHSAVFGSNGTSNTGITLVTGDTYLFAKYDGPNAGSEVWDLTGLTGTVSIPANGLAGQNYGLSGWTLFTAGPGTPTPDGGTTLMLLGSALAGLGMIRRLVKR
jgi:hypothetical protein